MISKKEISETIALSCVESYFLAWIKRYYPVERLYADSFISLEQVFDDFAKGATYQNYCYFPRVQDVAEEYGIVLHDYHVCQSDEALRLLRNQTGKELCLIRVNADFFVDYKRASWREDHYIYVNKNLEWINQYPLSDGCFTEEKFKQIYDGAVCIYRIKNFSAQIPDKIKTNLCDQTFEINSVPPSLNALEAAIGVLRISRKRLERYYEHNEIIRGLFHEENILLDKIYFDVHFQRLKGIEQIAGGNKTKAYSYFYQKIIEIVDLERKISAGIKE